MSFPGNIYHRYSVSMQLQGFKSDKICKALKEHNVRGILRPYAVNSASFPHLSDFCSQGRQCILLMWLLNRLLKWNLSGSLIDAFRSRLLRSTVAVTNRDLIILLLNSTTNLPVRALLF